MHENRAQAGRAESAAQAAGQAGTAGHAAPTPPQAEAAPPKPSRLSDLERAKWGIPVTAPAEASWSENLASPTTTDLTRERIPWRVTP